MTSSSIRYHNPCWNTADGNTPISGKFSDGGLPCVPCPIDVISRLPWEKGKVNTSVQNEFCSTDAYEDTLSVWEGIRQLRTAKSALAKGSRNPFYLAIGMHKPHMPWQYVQKR